MRNKKLLVHVHSNNIIIYSAQLYPNFRDMDNFFDHRVIYNSQIAVGRRHRDPFWMQLAQWRD